MNQSDRVTPEIVKPRKAGAGENIAAGIGFGTNVLGTLGRIF